MICRKSKEIFPLFENCIENVLSLFGFYNEPENQMDLEAASITLKFFYLKT
jgi:hypothetical protein